ncbi:MAG: N-acetylneuraminate synthase [Acidobacteriota bacterium]
MIEIAPSGRKIGDGHPVFVIAEAGVNHNGELSLAKELVDAANESGADAVKFQTWITSELVAADAPMAEYQQENVGTSQSQYEMLEALELSQSDFSELRDYAERRGILFFSTPDEPHSADFLDQLGAPLFKIGSGEVTNLPFLRYVAAKGKPLILSTGMSTLGEVEEAVRTIEATDNRQLILLHCVSDYPADPADCNLRALDTLRTAFGYATGFSDHTLGYETALAAVARGACVIEKHLTLDKSMAGPDHRASMNPAELADLVTSIRKVESALGTGHKRPTLAELETRKVVQKSIVTSRDLAAGSILQEADLALRRTSGGLPPAELPQVLGRRLKAAVSAEHPLRWKDLR